MKAACLYKALKNQQVQCRACSHFCRIQPGKQGICGVRENQGGTLFTRVYDKVIAAAVDPIEKKPLFHVKPGSTSFSIATVGCNLRCTFCQNADIAQLPVSKAMTDLPGTPASPQQIVDQALAKGCQSIAFTYNEPSVFIELAHDTAALAKSAGLATIFVTNGFMSPDLIEMVAPVLDAANVDLKAFTEDFYQDFCGARLAPVKENLIQLNQAGVMVEVTTLIIPGLNDAPEELKAMADFIARDLGPQTPWHLSRFHPAHEMTDRESTPRATLELAWQIARDAGLAHVYTGNLPGGKEDTHCPGCRTLVVRRQGYQTQNYLNPNGACPDCGQKIHGIF